MDQELANVSIKWKKNVDALVNKLNGEHKERMEHIQASVNKQKKVSQAKIIIEIELFRFVSVNYLNTNRKKLIKFYV